MTKNDLDLFCVCPPGLEALLHSELRELGFEGKAVPGGVELRAALGAAARCNLWSRLASRVLVRLGSVQATAFPELIKKARALPFEVALRKGAPVALRVTCKKSRLYHSDAVAERIHAAIEARLGGPVPLASPADEEDDAPAQLITARFDHDLCTISADASGALLHRRGWRARGGKAPLRETLAAATLRAVGFSAAGAAAPLVDLTDPLCGSGTIAIEAAQIARQMAPGLSRRFALEGWPAFDKQKWLSMKEEARGRQLSKSMVAIAASDLDAGAVAIARENARAAGVEADIEFTQRPLAMLPAATGAGLLLSNFPYGVRVGAGGDLRDLYRQLGEVARAKLRGWQIAVLAGDEATPRAAGLPFERKLKTQNGGLPVVLLAARVNMRG